MTPPQYKPYCGGIFFEKTSKNEKKICIFEKVINFVNIYEQKGGYK
jgi:hypothetical protein